MYHVGFSSSEPYINYAAVVIASIVLNTDKSVSYKEKFSKMVSLSEEGQEECYHFYILSDSVSQKTRDRLSALEERLNAVYPVKIHLETVDDRIFADCPRWHGSYVTYYKVLAADYLPQDAKRLIFLDADTLVVSDIRELFCYDLKGKGIGGVAESKSYVLKNRTGKEPFDFAKVSTYFNAGVLLFDTEYWRVNGMKQKALDFLKDYEVICAEQDALSAVFGGNAELLPYKYNMKWAKSLHPSECDTVAENFGRISEQQKQWFYEGFASPSIIHYSVRPWAGDGFFVSRREKKCYFYPNIDLWWEYAEKTPVFGPGLLAVKQTFAYKKRMLKNRAVRFFLQYPFVVKLLQTNDNFQWVIRKLEKPFKTLRNKWRTWKKKNFR